MKLFHRITLRAFSKEYEGDDTLEIKHLLEEMVPIDLEKEKLSVQRTTNYRHDGVTPIYILELALEKQRHINVFLQQLFSTLTKEQKQEIRDNMCVDEECLFYLRLERNALRKGQFEITTSGDCVHIRILIAAYPAKQEKAITIMDQFLVSQM